MDNLTVFYTGMFRFPDKDAAGKRVLNIAKAIEKFNNCENIIIGGWEQGGYEEKKMTQKISHFSFSLLDIQRTSKLKKLFSFLFLGLSVIPWMIKNRNRYSHVMLYNPPFLFTIFCLLIGSLLGKKLILDTTEWYESEHMVGGKYGPASIENWFRMRVAYPLVRNTIAISSFLESYFQKKNVHVIKIPPLGDDSDATKLTNEDDDDIDVTLLYAGSPGKKDRLDKFILEIIKNKTISTSVRFYIAGITKDIFLETFPACNINNSVLDSNCIFLGRISMSEVNALYKKTDYCIFFRENKRYAIAGFPSKYVEALSNRVPVITNGVGDIVSDFPQTGIIFEPGVDSIDHLIQYAYENKNLLRQNIASVYNSKYTINANVEKLEEFFRQIK